MANQGTPHNVLFVRYKQANPLVISWAPLVMLACSGLLLCEAALNVDGMPKGNLEYENGPIGGACTIYHFRIN